MSLRLPDMLSEESVTLLFVAVALISVYGCGPSPDSGSNGTEYHAYFLGGQSNMVGFGYSDELPIALSGPQPATRIYRGSDVPDQSDEGGLGLWAPLEPGFGAGFRTDGIENRLGKRFGPELSFSRRLLDLFPGRHIAIIKYARSGSSLSIGGTNLGTWDPDFTRGNGLNQYDFALRTMASALAPADIDGDGHVDNLRPSGIIWMQGESDASHETSADSYETNLTRLMALLRAAMHVDDLPVVIGRITDSGMDEDGQVMEYIQAVHNAQAAFVASDSCAAYVTEIDDYQHADDVWHYVSEAYIQMGAAFADAVADLEKSCSQ